VGPLRKAWDVDVFVGSSGLESQIAYIIDDMIELTLFCIVLPIVPFYANDAEAAVTMPPTCPLTSRPP
jgi:hypothetical protein